MNAGDAPLATINDLLRREAQSQLQERALPTAVSAGLKDCLCYEIYVPPSLRDKYRAKLLDFVQSQKVSGGAGGPGAAEADRRMEEEAKKVAEARRPRPALPTRALKRSIALAARCCCTPYLPTHPLTPTRAFLKLKTGL